MKKLIVLMLILALCAACFAGCGKNETSTTGGSESTGETSGADASTGSTQNDEMLSQEELETLPDEGEIDVLLPEIDIDMNDEPTEGTTGPAVGSGNPEDGNVDDPTEPETTGSTTAETTQPTQDDSNTEETTEPTQSATKPPKDYTGDKDDDFVVDFDDLIGKG